MASVPELVGFAKAADEQVLAVRGTLLRIEQELFVQWRGLEAGLRFIDAITYEGYSQSMVDYASHVRATQQALLDIVESLKQTSEHTAKGLSLSEEYVNRLGS